jgi:hypothetical protein
MSRAPKYVPSPAGRAIPGTTRRAYALRIGTRDIFELARGDNWRLEHVADGFGPTWIVWAEVRTRHAEVIR